MNENLMDLINRNVQLGNVMRSNEESERFGLSLSEEDAKLILDERKNSLKEQQRVEFGKGVINKIISVFCDSPYIDRDNYADMLIRLQDIFYLYKNETNDEMTDEELLNVMREQFDKLCFGDLDYLEGTCLADFADAVRVGYSDYQANDGYGEYDRFDVVPRWNSELFYDKLRELTEG